MDKEFYTKYSKDLDCFYCSWITKCKDGDEPVCVGGLLKHYKDQVKVLEKALELACEDVWKKSTCSPNVQHLKEDYKHISADALRLIKHDEDAKLEELENG